MYLCFMWHAYYNHVDVHYVYVVRTHLPNHVHFVSFLSFVRLLCEVHGRIVAQVRVDQTDALGVRTFL